MLTHCKTHALMPAVLVGAAEDWAETEAARAAARTRVNLGAYMVVRVRGGRGSFWLVLVVEGGGAEERRRKMGRTLKGSGTTPS